MLQVGGTLIAFRDPLPGEVVATIAVQTVPAPHVSDAQRRVLVALCRPYVAGGAYATPASNQQIADEVFLSVDAVKTHLRALFNEFGLADLPQNQKRATLAERAMQLGVITPSELG